MLDYPLKRPGHFNREDMLYEIIQVQPDYQEVEIWPQYPKYLPASIGIHRDRTSGWKVRHDHEDAKNLHLLRTTPDWSKRKLMNAAGWWKPVRCWHEVNGKTQPRICVLSLNRMPPCRICSWRVGFPVLLSILTCLSFTTNLHFLSWGKKAISPISSLCQYLKSYSAHLSPSYSYAEPQWSGMFCGLHMWQLLRGVYAPIAISFVHDVVVSPLSVSSATSTPSLQSHGRTPHFLLFPHQAWLKNDWEWFDCY